MKYRLHIEASSDLGLVVLSLNGEVIGEARTVELRDHARSLNLLIEEVLNRAAINMSQLAEVVVCGGPGSYTGLRIAMAVSKGICYALSLPLIIHNRLTLLAYNAYLNSNKSTPVTVILTARQNEYFIAAYDAAFSEILEPIHTSLEQLMQHWPIIKTSIIVTDIPVGPQLSLICGDESSTSNNCELKASTWSKFVLLPLNCNRSVNLFTAQPFYLKEVFTHNTL